jgi:hypothetical protein
VVAHPGLGHHLPLRRVVLRCDGFKDSSGWRLVEPAVGSVGYVDMGTECPHGTLEQRRVFFANI